MERFLPDSYYKNIFSINYKKLKEIGINLLLIDLDNTIAPFNIKECDLKTKEFIDNLKNNFDIILFSNSPKKRVEKFAHYLDIPYIYNAKKPILKNFNKIIKNKSETEVAVIGDQLLTDIKGGNKAGIYTILVDPISKYDNLFTKILRIKERSIKKELKEKGLFNGRYYDEKM